MEIERKYTVKSIPGDLARFESKKIVQAYLCREPVVRVRRSNDRYYMTYKGSGMVAREEYNLPLSRESFEHLLTKADGKVISKTRYLIPLDAPKFKNGYTLPDGCSLTVELDIFDDPSAPLIMAEVEFPDMEAADSYIPEDWFDEDVSEDPRYHNVNMAYDDSRKTEHHYPKGR
ncbi:MAG: CYTH domain-containing protein [Lachnospiraceae bacterium]|nr:CYTH domain-containing protein [Lachnospiraceae bacterium]